MSQGSLGDLAPWLGGAWVLAAGVLAPGWCLVRAFGVGGGLLERLVVAFALGRAALALAALLAASGGVLAALPVAAVLLFLVAGWLDRGRIVARWADASIRGPAFPDRADVGAVLVVLAAAAWLVAGVVGRSGLPDSEGTLLLLGLHTTNDPLTYLGIARRVAELGWPVEVPLAAGLPNLGHALWFGELVGFRAISGASWLDVVLRIRPHLDVASLALTSLVLARALGAGRIAGLAATLLLLLGGGLSMVLFWGLGLAGVSLNLLEIWQLHTGFLLPFNPIAPALQTGFAALLVLARVGGARAPAWAAGLLLAATFEIKLFLWPALVGALAIVACWRPPAGSGPALRRALGVALAASVPLVVAKALLALDVAGRARFGLELCIGCMPRFALDSATGDPFVMQSTFESFGLGDLLRPGWWLGTIGATVAWMAIGLGVRVAALPDLVRDSFGRAPVGGPIASVPASASALDPATAAARPTILRILGLATLLGFGAAASLSLPPQYANVAQFAWIGLFGLWPVLAVRIDVWLAAGRRARVALLFVLALPTGLFWPLHQGWNVAPFQSVTREEQALMERLRTVSSPEALIVEPAVLIDTARISPVTWLAGRQSYMAREGLAVGLDPAEIVLRREHLLAIFEGRAREPALAALRATGAGWIYAPAAKPLRFDPGPALAREFGNLAGTLWRVLPSEGSGDQSSPRVGSPIGATGPGASSALRPRAIAASSGRPAAMSAAARARSISGAPGRTRRADSRASTAPGASPAASRARPSW